MSQDDRKYSQEHEWAKWGNDGSVTVGITHYAQDQLGDIVFFELPEVGRVLKQAEKLGEVESVKSVSDIYSPVSGEILEVNQGLIDHPELVNEDPYEKGWLIRLKPAEAAEKDKLMTAAEYEAFLQSLGQ